MALEFSDSKRGICVWDATSGELIARLLAGNDESRVLSAGYLPDGRYIIDVSTNGIIRKWDVLTSSLVWERVTFEEQTDSGWITYAKFSPDRKSVVFGDDRGSIEIWDVDTGKRDDQPLEGHIGYITCLSFSSDGKYLASGSDDTTVMIWNVIKSEARTGPLRGHTEEVTAVDFSKDGNTIISGSEDKSIDVWDVNSGEVLRKIICKDEVRTVTYSPDGLFILARGSGWMSMWNVVDAMAAPKVFDVHEDEDEDEDESIWEASFSPDGSRFVTRCVKPNISDTIKIWDASWSVEETKATFEEQQGGITSISVSPSGKFIASGSYDGRIFDGDSIYLWNVLTGGLVKKLLLSSGVESLSFSPFNEQLIAFGSDEGEVQLWDVTNDVTVTIGNHKDSIRSIAFSPSNKKHVASGSDDATIRIWNIERRELEVSPMIGHDGGVTSIAYSPDGTRLVSSSLDNTVRIWNSRTGQLLSTLNRHSDDVNSVAYSFDGSRIVSGSDDKTIIVWDAQSGQIVCRPLNAAGFVKSVCFSPDGKQVLSSGFWGGDVRMQSLANLSFPHSEVTRPMVILFASSLTKDGLLLFDGSIRIWTLDTVSNDTTWELRDDNWVVSESGKLMMWIPNDLRKYLCHHRNISIFNRPFYLKLHFGSE